MRKFSYDVYVINLAPTTYGAKYGAIVNSFASEYFARQFAENQKRATRKEYAIVCGAVTVARTDDP